MAMLGFGLATPFRQSAMAIGLGLAYALVIESLVFGVLGPLGDSFKQIHDWFPIANAGHLQQSFGQVSSVLGVTVVSPGEVNTSGVHRIGDFVERELSNGWRPNVPPLLKARPAPEVRKCISVASILKHELNGFHPSSIRNLLIRTTSVLSPSNATNAAPQLAGRP